MADSDASGSSRSERRVALLRWGFPFIILLSTLSGQILLPHILQLHLSDGEYVTYIAVAATAAYLPLADAGMVVAVQRELSFLYGAGDKRAFAGEAQRAKRIFLFIGVACFVIAGIGMWSTFVAIDNVFPQTTSTTFRLSVIALLAATAFHVPIGGLHTIIQLSTGRLIAGQATGVLTIFGPLLALIVTLLATRDLALGLYANAIAVAVVAVWRKLDTTRILRIETAGIEPTPPRAHVGKLLLSGLPIKAAEVLPSSAFPHALSVSGPSLVLSAVPARTYANACRLVPQQFTAVLFSHLTRRMAGGPEEKKRGYREYAISATCLSAVHLIAVGVLGLIAVPVFRIWLPGREADIPSFLSALFVEQALLSAAIPSTLLFAVWGRLSVLGFVQLIGVIAGLAIFLLVVPIWPKAAFGIGFAAAASFVFILGALAELRSEFRTVRGVARYASAMVAAVACALYARWPIAMSLAVLACASIHVPVAIAGLRELFAELRPRTS
jgi:hypothetical protein